MGCLTFPVLGRCIWVVAMPVSQRDDACVGELLQLCLRSRLSRNPLVLWRNWPRGQMHGRSVLARPSKFLPLLRRFISTMAEPPPQKRAKNDDSEEEETKAKDGGTVVRSYLPFLRSIWYLISITSPRQRFTRRKYLLLLSYSGKGYMGMQR